jgi:hypothetical protein
VLYINEKNDRKKGKELKREKVFLRALKHKIKKCVSSGLFKEHNV